MITEKWTQLSVNDDVDYRTAALIVPSGIVLRTREFSMLGGKTEVTNSESTVFVPCTQKEAAEWITSHMCGSKID